MSPCYRWLVGGMESRSENTLELQVYVWSFAWAHLHPSPIYYRKCKNKPLYGRSAVDALDLRHEVAQHETHPVCGWKHGHGWFYSLVLGLFALPVGSCCFWDFHRNSGVSLKLRHLRVRGSPCSNGSYVTLVTGTLCQRQLSVPISYCSINSRVRCRLPHFTVWRSFPPKIVV